MPRRDLSRIACDPTLRAAALRACPPGEREKLERELVDSVRQRARRASAGAAAHAHGDAFEAWLQAQHDLALVLRIATRITHTGPVVVFDRTGTPHVVAAGGADYQGTLTGGRSLVIEAKSRSSRLARSDLPQHQADDLEACARGGGLALLVYEHQASGRRFAVPWASVPWSARGGLGPEECERWEIAAGERCYLAKLMEVRGV